MVTPLRNQAADEQGTDEQAALRYSAAWTDGAARAADARCALRAFLAHAPRNGRTRVPAPLALDAELTVSELVTNAIRHAPGPCGMLLQLSGEELTITVWDTSPEKPTVHRGDRYRIGGHGLHLVHTVSHSVVVASQAAGKRITAHLRLRAGNRGSLPASR
ncbi:ATP-binding protein [Streptomyces sp. NPDC102405]|jgi:anti-sigma regulatory factor (Ser/Thr protein kinase)|uniref:ATP-binding protein n=1 Tax=Streptomyces sp. NPDC102405 TaxID=3366170 RepID=UPI0037FD255D